MIAVGTVFLHRPWRSIWGVWQGWGSSGKTAAVFCAILIPLILYDQITKRVTISRRTQGPKLSQFTLEPADDFNSKGRRNGVDIIFVHGLGSNPDTTWGQKEPRGDGSTALEPAGHKAAPPCWVTEFFPGEIPNHLRKNVRMWFYNYDSYFQRDAPIERMETFASKLLHCIDRIRKTEKEKSRNIVFVAHSYGGLVVKKAIVLAKKNWPDVVEHTSGIIFLGTPHRGSDFAVWGSHMARFFSPLGSNPLIPAEMKGNSPELLALHKTFTKSIHDKLRVVNFFETRKCRLLKVWLVSIERLCVTEESATYNDKERKIDNIPLAVDHYGLNKFYSDNDAHYRFVKDKLLELVKPLASRGLKRIHSLVQAPVGNFVSRHDLSEEIITILRKDRGKNADVPFAVAIHGMGGAGKTQLALKYVQDNAHQYSTILWIDATDKESVRWSFERCAYAIGLELDNSQSDSNHRPVYTLPAVVAVCEWLRKQDEEDDKWLMVVDSADDFKFDIKKALPRGPQGTILITSRDQKSRMLVQGGCEGINVGEMHPEEAKELILQHVHKDGDSIPEDTEKMAEELTELLGYLPLAISLAAMTVGSDADKRYGLKRYLEDYKIHQDELLSNNEYEGLMPENKTVWTVWDTTIQKLEEWYPDRRPGQLLGLLARFRARIVQDEIFRLASFEIHDLRRVLYAKTSTDVPLPEWLTKVLRLKSESREWDSYDFAQGLGLLTQYNLIQKTEDDGWPGVTMHNLVKWRAKRYEADKLAARWHFLVIMAAMSRYAEEPEHKLGIRLFANMTILNDRKIEELEIREDKMWHIWPIIQNICLVSGYHQLSRQYAIRMRKEFTKAYPDLNSPNTREFLSDIPRLYRQEGNFDLAIREGESLMASFLDLLGPDHKDTLGVMTELARAYRGRARWEDAEKLCQHVLESGTKSDGPDSGSELLAYAELGDLRTDQGLWDEAQELFTHIVKTACNIGMPSNLIEASFAEHAMRLDELRGNWAQLAEWQENVVKARVEQQGEEHPDTLRSRSTYGIYLAKSSKGLERSVSVPLGKRSIKELKTVREIKEKFLGWEHPVFLESHADVCWYRMIVRLEDADKFLQVLSMLQEFYGEANFVVLRLRSNLAEAYVSHGQYKEAAKHYETVYRLKEKILVPTHPEALRAKTDLAYAWGRGGEHEKAIAALTECYETLKRTLGDFNGHTKTALEHLEDGRYYFGSIEEGGSSGSTTTGGTSD